MSVKTYSVPFGIRGDGFQVELEGGLRRGGGAIVITSVLTMAAGRLDSTMSAKTEQVQIRVSSAEKAALRERAAEAGMGISAYVLARALPHHGYRFAELVQALEGVARSDRSYVLAELNDFLSGLAGFELADAVDHVGHADLAGLGPYVQNYVAAMVEQACYLRSVLPPAWTSDIAALEEPHFASDLESLRPHLLRASPVPFKRRNIFIDASIGDRL